MKHQEEKRALITGASYGIGLELARVFARHGHPLVLVARSGDKLENISKELSMQHRVPVEIISKDLSKPTAPDELFQEIRERALPIEILVNNAGFGHHGRFSEANLAKNLNMLDLNIKSLTHLTHLFLQEMIARKSGRVLNLASTASFQTGPLMAVYYATKAYVLSFSEALSEELRGTGVHVAALCPGPTATHFQERANLHGSRFLKIMPVMSASKVAEVGYIKMMKNRRVIIPGLINAIGARLPRFAPRGLTRRVMIRINEKSGS